MATAHELLEALAVNAIELGYCQRLDGSWFLQQLTSDTPRETAATFALKEMPR